MYTFLVTLITMNTYNYNNVLSDISGCMIEHKIDYCVIACDLNTHLSRLNSGNTLSLQSFVANKI